MRERNRKNQYHWKTNEHRDTGGSLEFTLSKKGLQQFKFKVNFKNIDQGLDEW